MQRGMSALELLSSNLQEQSAKLMEHIKNIKSDFQDAAKQNLNNVRAEGAIREKAIRPFVAMGTPAVLAKWLFAHNGIHPVDEPHQ